MEPVLFSRTIRLCLDTLDVNIFSLLSNLKASLSKEYATYRTLSIHSKKFSYSTEFIPLTFTKEVDTRTLPLTEGSDAELLTLMKYASKQQTHYFNAHTEIYSSTLNGTLISLIGHPGTGKSFYCNKLVSDYSNRDNATYRFVLLIACRSMEWHLLEEQCMANPGKKSEMLELFLNIIIPSFANCEDIVRIILNTEGNGLLLVIDSFDEYPQSFKFNATLLYRILKRQVLTRSTILITSRPGAWNQLLRGYGSEFSFDYSWQILGFSPEQRNNFITTTLSQDKATTCHAFLQTHPELDILTLVPVNISLLTGLVDSTALLSNIHTLTDMYINLVLFTLDNEIKRYDKQSTAITNLNDLPADMLAQFNTLTELAYQGVIKRQITFSPKDFPDITTLTNKYAKGLGLFNVITVNTTQLTTIDYLSCPHLTLQEFLAAWHLAQKSTTYIASIVKQTFSDDTWPAMKMCIRFMCGLLTQGHNSILSIITDNLHYTSASLFNCKYSLFDYVLYTNLHYNNTDTHLSVLPYVLETNQPSILSSYYKLLCPANTSIPHFYLRDSITPVDTYSLTQFFIKLPSNSTISVLSLEITLLNSIQLDMLASSFNTIIIDTLLVIFSPITDTTLKEYYKKQLPIYIEHIQYEIQQLHINTNNMSTLLEELNDITSNTFKFDIYKLQHILSTLKLTISNFTQHAADITHYQKLFSFIRNISNNSYLHTPNQICYLFYRASFMGAIIINLLIDSISSNATYVMLNNCHFTTEFITTLVTSLQKLEYLYIYDLTLNELRSLLKQPTINAVTFQMLKERKIKGLYLQYVTLQDSILYEYLHSQSSLQEIYLFDTTYSTPATLHAILHLSSLQYIHILANDRALYRQHANTEESMSALLTILHNNSHTLSYADFTFYDYFLTACYADIMLTLSQCSNLQCINFYNCPLTPLHMQALATTINQLHALLYINMRSNSDITDEGIVTLTNTLTTHNTVIWINLTECSLSSVPVIISLINKFPCLQKILLHSNKFTDTSKQEVKMFAKQRKIKINIY